MDQTTEIKTAHLRMMTPLQLTNLRHEAEPKEINSP
jgi:hypothetical protein